MCRRTDIIDRILSKVNIEDTGFVVNGQSNPCFLWQGGTSGNGRGGGYGRIHTGMPPEEAVIKPLMRTNGKPK